MTKEERKEYDKEYYERNKEARLEYQKEYRKKNKEAIAERDKEYYEKNKEAILERNKEYRKKNKETIAERKKEYCKKNKEVIAEYHKEYMKKRYHTDPKFRLNDLISKGIRKSLKNGKEGKSWRQLVPYTLEELKTHLESQFEEPMTWDNHGTYWHIDHIVPVSAFNFENPDDYEFQVCWDLSNLQPLEASENFKKSNRLDYYIEKEQQQQQPQ